MRRHQCIEGDCVCGRFDPVPADDPTYLTQTKDATGVPDVPRYRVTEGVRTSIRGGATWPR